MDLLLSVQALIIAVIIGALLAHSLNIKMPMQIALIITIVFAAMWYLFDNYNWSILMSSSNDKVIYPVNNPVPSATMPLATPTPTPTLTSNEDEDALPFDNLEPSELMRRLNMIYAATANPLNVAHHQNEMTYADKMVLLDGASLASDSDLHLTYANWLYPQLTKEQVNANDCTNYESGEKSCVQKPTQLNDYPLKACSKYNMPPDDYSKSMEHALMRAGGIPVLEAFTNSNSNSNSLYYNAASWSNDKSKANLCRTCKIGICKNDICM